MAFISTAPIHSWGTAKLLAPMLDAEAQADGDRRPPLCPHVFDIGEKVRWSPRTPHACDYIRYMLLVRVQNVFMLLNNFSVVGYRKKNCNYLFWF